MQDRLASDGWIRESVLSTKTIVLTAVEDDQILLTHTVLTAEGRRYQVAEMGEPQKIERLIDPVSPDVDDQGEIDLAALGAAIADYVAASGIVPDAAAVSSFGNVDLKSQVITHAPSGRRRGQLVSYDFPEMMRKATSRPDLPVFVDNDATACALGEQVWGVGKGAADFGYIWFGRGLNVGLVLGNEAWRGQQHPEAGHAYGRIHAQETHLGNCPVHRDCFIGLASHRSILERRADGVSDYNITEIISYYLAQVCVNVVTFAAPQRIAIGGYVMRQNVIANLVPAVRSKLRELLGHYPHYGALSDLESFIQEAETDPMASLLGLLENSRRRMSLDLARRKS